LYWVAFFCGLFLASLLFALILRYTTKSIIQANLIHLPTVYSIVFCPRITTSVVLLTKLKRILVRGFLINRRRRRKKERNRLVYLDDENGAILYVKRYDHQLVSCNPYFLRHWYNQMLEFDWDHLHQFDLAMLCLLLSHYSSWKKHRRRRKWMQIDCICIFNFVYNECQHSKCFISQVVMI